MADYAAAAALHEAVRFPGSDIECAENCDTCRRADCEAALADAAGTGRAVAIIEGPGRFTFADKGAGFMATLYGGAQNVRN